MKQRLWGAAVLIALAVVFLPMLVKGPAPDSGVSDVPLDSPRAPDATVKTQELPLDVPGAVGQGGATGMPAPQAAAAATTAPAQPDPAPPAVAATTPATAAGDYAVNFGSYGSSSDADRVVQALGGIQLHGYSEKVSLGGRDAWRVRVGPYPTLEAAEVARVQSGKLNAPAKAQVIALDASPPGTTTAPLATNPAQPATAQSATATTAASKPAEPPVATKAIERPKPTEPAKTEKPVAATKPRPAPIDAKPAMAEQDATTAKRDEAKPEPQPATKPAAAGTGFAVQLGAFANAAEATALRDRARAAGFSATTDTVHTDKGVLTRVRLGPVVGRDAAESLKSRAQSKLGIAGIVRPSP